MAYNALNNLIDAYIYANGVQAITGQILNGVLKQMVSQLGSGYHLMGVAGPQTVPATEDYAMAYFAASAGEYTAFGDITLAAGEVAVLLTSGNGSWEKQTIYTVPTTTEDLENTAGFITNAVNDLVNYYTKAEIDTQKAGTDAAIAARYTKTETDTKLAEYYKKTETYDKSEVDSIIAALSSQEYIVAWDGLSAPDVSAIPAGVTVTYSGNPYTGTLAASASTMNKIYMVWNGTAYDMYGTSRDGGYSWVPMGTTTVDLSQYVTKEKLAKDSYLTADIRSKFILHYTHNGDGTYGPNQARNAITSPLRYEEAVIVKVGSGQKFAIQFFDGYETGTSHFIYATEWIYDIYTIPAGSYWCIIVANFDDSTTDQNTTNSLYFEGVADGGLLVNAFDELNSKYEIITHQDYAVAYTFGTLDFTSDRKVTVNVGNLVCRIGASDYIIPSGSTFTLSNISYSVAALWAIIFDEANLRLIAKPWNNNEKTDRIIAYIISQEEGVINGIGHCVVPYRFNGRKYNVMGDVSLSPFIWAKFKVHLTHNGDGTYGQSQTRNAIDTPMVFGEDIKINVESGFKFALQYYDGPETGTSHLISASAWINSSFVIPSNTYWCIIVANADDTITTEETTLALTFEGNYAGDMEMLNTLEKIKEISDIVSTPDDGISYYGRKIQMCTFRVENFKPLTGATWSQSMAIYGDYVVFFSNAGQTAKLFSIASGQLLETFSIPNGGYVDPHCNTACVGVEFASANSIMPAIYVSQWDAGHERACFVYDIQNNNGVYTLSLIQKVNLSGVSSSIIGVGECDFAVDRDNGKIYAFAYKTSVYTDFGTKTMVCKFALPSLSGGNEIFITDADLEDHFEMELIKYRQDAFFNNGQIFLANGGLDDVKAYINVIDVSEKKVVSRVPIYKYIDGEPECLDMYDITKILFNYGTGLLELHY